ncbi:MAG: response regulator transcription factor [Reyranella sp.]|nr:MAG: response regulator transcription factor [Reyranella sp.]TBR26195.1 MAG: response regulator transcription factor [Reyranella sp.]
MRRLLAAHPDVEIAGEADSGEAARAHIIGLRPDLVFLDIELGGGGDGFDLLDSLERPPIVIFVTAFAEHAVEAFAVDAVDYLLKPVEPQRLEMALARAARQLALQSLPPGPGVIELRTPRRVLFVTPAEIVAICADGDFTRVFVAGQAAVMILRTLAHFEGVLPAPPFVRLGRSVMINRDRLRSLEAPTRSTGRLVLDGMEHPLAIGRAAMARLRELLADRS